MNRDTGTERDGRLFIWMGGEGEHEWGREERKWGGRLREEMELTTSYAMMPGASVSGWYFSHPDSRYFAVAQIQDDQVKSYAERKGWDSVEAEKWLGPNING